jgi:hypothetical protein
MRMPRRAAWIALALTAALAALAAGCGRKRSAAAGPPPEVSGLAAVPSDADVIVGMDVARLAESPIIARAIDMLLQREPSLAGRWQALRESCKLDVKSVHHIMIALGPPPPGGRFGTGPMVMIATGKIAEPELVKCVRDIVGKGGGSLVVKEQDGRTLYHVKDGTRTMYIAFGRPDTVILGNSDRYVVEAVGGGKKALEHPELAAWLKLADQRAPVWVVGRVAERLKAGLIRASDGTLKAGAKAYVGSLDLTEGVKGELLALMESPEDAKQLESLVNVNLVPLSWAAQVKSLAKVVKKLSVSSKGPTVRFSAPLTMDDVNRLLSALDADRAPAQDSPPAGGSASTPPAP